MNGTGWAQRYDYDGPYGNKKVGSVSVCEGITPIELCDMEGISFINLDY